MILKVFAKGKFTDIHIKEGEVKNNLFFKICLIGFYLCL